MSSLLADTHNVVAILEKSDATEGFEQIIDFLSGSYIHYALIVSPHIYISCIKQFWNSVSVKRSGDVTRLQALVDKKKIVISEAVIHEILQLNDVEGVIWLQNEEIFAGQRFNFSKYIFDSLVCNVDSSSKFYMYPRFIQLIIQAQVGDLSAHNTRFISPALTQKVFANMRRVGKGFSGVKTPLFEEDVDEDVAHVATPSPPPHGIPSPPQEPSLPPQQPHVTPPAPTQGEAFLVTFQQVLDTCSALLRHVEHLEHDNVAQRLDIVKLKARVKKLEQTDKVKSLKLRMNENEGIELVKDAEIVESEGRQADKQAKIYNIDLDHSSKVLSMQEDDSEPTISAAAPTVVAAYTRRRKGVIIRDSEEELSLKTSETPAETPKPMKKKDQIEMDAEYARKLQEEIDMDHDRFNKDVDWNAAMDHVNQKSSIEDVDDDVFVESTPLASKVPVVDYQIVLIDNKPRFKIIKADDTHKLYISFATLLKKFNREDLETLWRIVKDRFSTSKPTNFSDEYLLLTLKTMFEEPDGQDAIWRNQKSVHGLALVKRWKLLTLCGVHIITLSTVQLFLLVERRYPLSRFTLEQLVNVARLQVEEESEMSLELLKFTRQQL
nr:hypothetical protein [Tanacetum cinerariifolium]